jgi:DNA-binding GntR family transcriptional regulator
VSMCSSSKIDEICSGLRKQLVDRSIPPDTRLSGNSLSRKWNVSRTPMREALRRLESEGLVTFSRYKGYKVNTITIKDLEDLYAIKISLEGLAGRLASPILSANPEKLQALEKSCKQMESLSRKGDTEAYAKSNDEFHFHIWNSCENKWLIKILENLSLQIRRFIVKDLKNSGPCMKFGLKGTYSNPNAVAIGVRFPTPVDRVSM